MGHKNSFGAVKLTFAAVLVLVCLLLQGCGTEKEPAKTSTNGNQTNVTMVEEAKPAETTTPAPVAEKPEETEKPPDGSSDTVSAQAGSRHLVKEASVAANTAVNESQQADTPREHYHRVLKEVAASAKAEGSKAPEHESNSAHGTESSSNTANSAVGAAALPVLQPSTAEGSKVSADESAPVLQPSVKARTDSSSTTTATAAKATAATTAAALDDAKKPSAATTPLPDAWDYDEDEDPEWTPGSELQKKGQSKRKSATENKEQRAAGTGRKEPAHAAMIEVNEHQHLEEWVKVGRRMEKRK